MPVLQSIFTTCKGCPNTFIYESRSNFKKSFCPKCVKTRFLASKERSKKKAKDNESAEKVATIQLSEIKDYTMRTEDFINLLGRILT